MDASPFAENLKLTPYWWEDAPRPEIPRQPVPGKADVAVIGAGYTGLTAAIVLARAGRSVHVFDSEDAAWGCSARNGGQLGWGLKASVGELTGRYGRDATHAMLREAHASLDYITGFIQAEQIDCDFRPCGRFVGAHRPGSYEALARRFEELNEVVPMEWHMVPRSEVAQEIGTEAYHGGAILPQHCGLQPAKYANGLIELARKAGATIHTHTPVTGLDRDGATTTVVTGRGSMVAGDVLVATNGYTKGLTPGLQRRLIPIGSYVITTEELPADVMRRVMPKYRVMSDTRRVVYYFRPSPDHRRIVFGGRVALSETDPRTSGARLHAVVVGLFPELKTLKVSHSWMGFIAYTFDHLPHLGRRDGLWYAMGYCGSGVAKASYFGHKIAHQMLGNAEGKTAFDGLEFQTRPLYTGNPWFLAAAVAYYRARDRWGR